MERKQKDKSEIQDLGVFGIWKHSFKIISKQPRTFLLLTAALTIPQALLTLIHRQLSLLILTAVTEQLISLSQQNLATPGSFNSLLVNAKQRLLLYSLVDLSCLLINCIICVLSVSAVTYAAALVHYRITPPKDEITFKKVMGIIPRVWKSIVGTLIWIFGVVLVSDLFVMGLLVGIVCAIVLGQNISGGGGGNNLVVVIVTAVILILYFVALIYFELIAYVALVISVLEEGSHKGCRGGYQYLVKSRALLKGNMRKAIAINILIGICTGLVVSMLDKIMASFHDASVLGKIGMTGLGAIGFLGMVFLFLYGYVLQMVLYAVCKSYHGERIDKTTILSDDDQYFLQSSARDYTPLLADADDEVTNNIDQV